MKPLRKTIRAGTLESGLSALAFFLVGSLMIWLAYQQISQFIFESAENKAEILLHHNLAIHTYFSKQLKPDLLKMSSAVNGKDYFDPVWMSSTFAVREINSIFRSYDDLPEYYYKEASISARDPRNEADSTEQDFIHRLNQDPTLKQESGVRFINNTPYYVTMIKGEVMDDSCLACHNTPEQAPKELVDRYGAVSSFHRQAGEVVSAISIRIPLAAALQSASALIIRLGLVLLMALLVLFIFSTWLHQQLMIRPIERLREKSLAIIQNEHALRQEVDLPFGKELSELTEAFNQMALTLSENEARLEQMIHGRTRELHQSQHMLNGILGTIPHFVSVVDFETGQFRYINRKFKRFLGDTTEVILSRRIKDYRSLLFKADIEVVRKFIRDISAAQDENPVSAQFRLLQASDDYCWLEFQAMVFQRDENGRPQQVLFTSQDITVQKEAEEKLKFMGLHDQMTGLYNRAHFAQMMDHYNSAEYYPLTVLMADVDNLKVENDTYGHDAGDALICRMAQALKSSLRSNDLVARLGGDEFAALLPNTTPVIAESIRKRIQRKLESLFTPEELARVGLSIGMATISQPDGMQDALKQADLNMYAEKARRKAAAPNR